MNRTHPERIVAPAGAGLAAALRLIPLAGWNVAPVGALALYGGARLPWWAALGLPLGLMYATDLILWRTTGARPLDLFVYGSYAAIALIGMLLRRTSSPTAIGLAAVASSALFFLVTNYGSWLDLRGPAGFYDDSLTGLLACYAAGLEFARGTIVGDLLFTPVLFGVHALLGRRAEPAPVPVP
jgi:hypothetical protein